MGEHNTIEGIDHLNYWGIVFNHAGYAGDNRDFIRTLYKMGVRDMTVYTIEENRTIELPDEDFFERLLPMSLKYPDGISVFRDAPSAIDRRVKDSGKLIGYSQCEFETVPKMWRRKLNYCDEVWVCSQWQKRVYEDNLIEPPCHVVPLGIDTNLWKPMESEVEVLTTEGKDVTDQPVYRFYTIGHWHPRKGVDLLLKAFFEEFEHDEPVELIIKTFMRENEKLSSVDEQNMYKANIDMFRKMVGVERAPKVYFVTDRFSDKSMVAFHNTFDCFVLPTRGEGWGKPVYEAMACGKPTIITNATGITEYATEDNAFLITSLDREPAYGMETVCPEVNGMLWQVPDIMELRYHMRYVFEHQDKAKEVGLKAREAIKKYSWEYATGIMIERLKALSEG